MVECFRRGRVSSVLFLNGDLRGLRSRTDSIEGGHWKGELSMKHKSKVVRAPALLKHSRSDHEPENGERGSTMAIVAAQRVMRWAAMGFRATAGCHTAPPEATNRTRGPACQQPMLSVVSADPESSLGRSISPDPATHCGRRYRPGPDFDRTPGSRASFLRRVRHLRRTSRHGSGYAATSGTGGRKNRRCPGFR